MIAYTSNAQANARIRSYVKGAITRDELLWELRYELLLGEKVIKDLVRNFI